MAFKLLHIGLYYIFYVYEASLKNVYGYITLW